MTKPKKKKGRVPVSIDNAQVEILASRGLTLEQISNSLGIATSTLCLRKSEEAELSEAIKRGRATGIKMVSNALFESAMSGNVAAQIFFLKNRAPEEWRDKVDITVEESVPKPLVIEVPYTDVTPEPQQILSLNGSQDIHKSQ